MRQIGSGDSPKTRHCQFPIANFRLAAHLIADRHLPGAFGIEFRKTKSAIGNWQSAIEKPEYWDLGLQTC
jgi:hypothetical protein